MFPRALRCYTKHEIITEKTVATPNPNPRLLFFLMCVPFVDIV